MKFDQSRPSDLASTAAPMPSFPSACYFQVHFEYLHQVISDLGTRLETIQNELADLRRQQAGTALEAEAD
jgi:hypothetical protein